MNPEEPNTLTYTKTIYAIYDYDNELLELCETAEIALHSALDLLSEFHGQDQPMRNATAQWSYFYNADHSLKAVNIYCDNQPKPQIAISAEQMTVKA